MTRRKRTKVSYSRLYDSPTNLFGGTCEVILFPNGEPEIWIRSTDGMRSFKITASDGPAGLAINVSTRVGGAPISVGGNLSGSYDVAKPGDFAHVSLCQFKPDAWSQAFKAWYDASPEERESIPYPGDRPTDDDEADDDDDDDEPTPDDDEADEPTPDEEDGFIFGRTEASFAGRYLGRFSDEEAAEEAIRAAGNEGTGFFPNVWRVSDHGNHHLIDDFWSADFEPATCESRNYQCCEGSAPRPPDCPHVSCGDDHCDL